MGCAATARSVNQPDVFDSAPGDEGYSPLRALHLGSWKKGAKARVLRSVKEVKGAEEVGDLTRM